MRMLVYALLAAAFVLLPTVFPTLSFVFVLALSKGFAALGVALLLRAGLISIGHAMFFAFGAYVAAFMTTRAAITDLVAILVLATVLSAVAGVLIGAFMVRYRAIFFAMLNLALSMVFFTLLAKLYHVTGGTDGVRVALPTIGGVAIDRAAFEWILLYGGLVLFGVIGYAVHRYLASPMGEALSAVHTNEVRLEYLGISVHRVLLSAYALSAALAGLGGALTAIAVGHVIPEMSYWTVSGHLVLTAVLGGVGSVIGPLIGSVFLEVIRSLAVGYVADAWNLIVGVTLIIVIFFLPSGLHGLLGGLLRRRREP